jgi:hypothetical protein
LGRLVDLYPARDVENARVATVRRMLRTTIPIAAVAVSAALALPLSACGGDDETVSVPTAPTSTPTTQTAPTVTTPTQTTAPETQTTTTQTTTAAPSDSGSGGTAAPSDGSGGSSSGETPNERFKKYCEQNPGACGE